MAFTIIEIPDGTSSTQDREWKRTYTRCFRVTSDDRYKLAGSARAAVMSYASLGIGTHYKVYESNGTTVAEEDTGSFVTSISATYDGGDNDGLEWLVTVEYSSYDATLFPANPLDHPIRLSWGTNKFEKVCEKDISSNAIVNSAGDLFDPPVTIDDSRPLLTITRNLATFDATVAHSYKDSINNATWNGYAAYSWKVEDITAELRFNGECGWYFEVTYQLALNPNLWKKEILDQGLRQVVSGNKTNIKDDNGEDITSPVPLDGSGGKLAVGGTPVYLLFEVYPEVDFGTSTTGLMLDFSTAPGW